jgi:hypothetical protein
MSTYKNGPGNVPRLPERVVDTLIDSAGVSCCAPGPTAATVRDQTAQVEQLVHDACEELLARLPAGSGPEERIEMAIASLADEAEANGKPRKWVDAQCRTVFDACNELQLAPGNRGDFYLLANCRRMLSQRDGRRPNWAIASDLFATGSNSARQICLDAGIDPDGFTVERAAPAAAGTLAKPLTSCAAGRDGECGHTQCPQLRDGEPAKSGRHCPLDNRDDD